jgi:VanZ family protein
MTVEFELESTPVEQRSFRWLCFVYSLFIVYGSFIPFDYTTDHEVISSQLSRFFAAPYAEGSRKFSIPDVISNVLLFVPFGFFLTAGALWENVSRRLWRAFLAAGLLGFTFGFGIEIGQTVFPGRNPSFLDVLSNASGAAAGGGLGRLFLQSLSGKLAAPLAVIAHERPSILLLLLLLLVAATDAFYPFHITLDVSTVWENFKRTQWIPIGISTHGFWADLLIQKTLLFAAIAFLIFQNLSSNVPAKKFTIAASIGFALALEFGKLLFAGKAPNMRNFFFSTIGAVAGVSIVPQFANTRLVKDRAHKFVFFTLLVVTVYSELTPFDWVGSTKEFFQRISKIEWLPFAAYYYTDPEAAVFDLAKKFVLLASVGFMVAALTTSEVSYRGWSISVFVGFILGMILEAAQIAVRSRTPSVTDVLLFGLGSACGGYMFERYKTLSANVIDSKASFMSRP